MRWKYVGFLQIYYKTGSPENRRNFRSGPESSADAPEPFDTNGLYPNIE